MKKIKIVLSIILIIVYSNLFSQVGIGTVTPNAALEISSINDGILIPRIALTATNVATIVTPTESEIVYNTATSAVGANQVTPGFYYWNGTNWNRLGGNTASIINNGNFEKFDQFNQRPTGLTATDAGKKYLYTQTGNFHLWTGTSWQVLFRDYVNVRDYGAVGDGIADDTAAIQAAMLKGGNMFNQSGYPPAGADYDSPTVLFGRGAFRITNTIDIYLGMTVSGVKEIANTVSACRIIMDTNGGTTNRDIPIFRLTTNYNGAFRAPNVTVTISDLEFWIVNPGATVLLRTGTGWQYNAADDSLGFYKGCAIYSNENLIDTRINRCNFYSMPNAAIFFESTDPGKKFCNVFITDCEFDTPVTDIRVKNVDLNLFVIGTEFYDGAYSFYAENCTGNVSFSNNFFITNPNLKVTRNSALTSFNFVANTVDTTTKNETIALFSPVEAINISSNSFTGKSTINSKSCINILDCKGGVISGNNFINCNRNASAIANSDSFDSEAVIKLTRCQNVNISGNTIMNPADITGNGYGYGILCLNSNDPSLLPNLISNNIVSKFFISNQPVFRTQGRQINVSGSDIKQGNVE